MARAPIMMERIGATLQPADAYAEQQMADIPNGKMLSVRISVMSASGKTEREGNRGLWWAGLELLAQNCDDPEFDTKEKAKDTLMRLLGFTRPYHRIDGTVVMEPVSTADNAMDDEEFSVLMKNSATYVVARFGWDPWETWKEQKEVEEKARQANRARWDRS